MSLAVGGREVMGRMSVRVMMAKGARDGGSGFLPESGNGLMYN
jgi:hypothetical protein